MSLILKIWPRPKVVVQIKEAAGVLDEPQKPELADIFRKFGDLYCKNHPVTYSHLKVINAIKACRTSELGGHMKVCSNCGYSHPVYNSCGNRHCPKCQSLSKARWVAKRQAELLPTVYYHAVFTLPHMINAIARANSKAVYNLLFRSVSETLLKFGQNELGGKVGFISILHTWDQKLAYHIHLHCIIPGGALSADKRWIGSPHKDFLFSVGALSAVFKGKFTAYLKKAYKRGDISYDRGSFEVLIEDLYKENWVVYLKKPFAGPAKAISYLGRYTHRVAISDGRIKAIGKEDVTFSYRDRKDSNRIKEATLSGTEFIKRFLGHVLPRYFTRIRHFGFLANRNRKKNINLLRGILGLPPQVEFRPESTEELMLRLAGVDITLCPRCRVGRLRVGYPIPRPKVIRGSPVPNLLYLK